MVLVSRRLLFILLILLLSATFVRAEPACIVPNGNDYQCFLESAYNGDTSFSTWCADQPGASLGDSNDDRCNQVCCCGSGYTDAVSYTTCSNYISTTQCSECSIQPPPSSGQDCTAVCGEGGSVSGTYTITGTVYDDGADIDTDGNPDPLPAARIQYPDGSTLVTLFTDEAGTFTLTNIPASTISVKASRAGCGAETKSVIVTGDTSVEFHLNCATGGCTVAAVNDTTATPIPGEAKVEVSWTPSECSSAAGNSIYRCDENLENCLLIGFTNSGSLIDVGVQPDTTYCYKVDTLLTNGQIIEQGDVLENCVGPMNHYCLDGGATEPTCFNNDETVKPLDADGNIISLFTGVAYCTEKNQVEVVDACGAGESCYVQNGHPACGTLGHCDACNGILGWFLDHAARPLLGNSYTCADLAGCTLTNDGFAEDTYVPCSQVKSCYDYHTKASCEEGSDITTDVCGVSEKGCQWVSASMEELGKGVCVDRAESGKVPCDSCSDFFGFCNKELCENILGGGDACYYNNESFITNTEPGAGACVSREEMACRYYDTESDCGSSPVTVDVTYNSSGDRVAGTNEKVEGNDLFGFGTCRWIDDPDAYPGNDGYCVKDANNYRVDPGMGRLVDDCLERDPTTLAQFGVTLDDCFRDNTPPTTTLPFAEGSYLDVAFFHQPDIKPIVTDNTFPPAAITSHFCLVPRGGSCYPDTDWHSLFPEDAGVQAYTLYYYSEDPAGNLEPLKSIDVNIDRNSEVQLVEARLIQ